MWSNVGTLMILTPIVGYLTFSVCELKNWKAGLNGAFWGAVILTIIFEWSSMSPFLRQPTMFQSLFMDMTFAISLIYIPYLMYKSETFDFLRIDNKEVKNEHKTKDV